MATAVVLSSAVALSSAACDSRPVEARLSTGTPPEPQPAKEAPVAAASNASPTSEAATPATAANATDDDHVVWRPLGEWSGHESLQTESFGESGSFRIKWKAANERVKGKGHFSLTIHSAISGRPLQVAVEDGGVGEGTAYVSEDPRIFFAVVDAGNLDWSFTIEEALTR